VKFTLGQVLSITTGKLLCEIGGVYAILNHMTGDNLYTHQLPRASRECAPHLLKQFPQLAAVNAENVGRDNWATWLHDQVLEHGNEFEVATLPEHAHEVIDPLSELAEQVHPDKIIVVDRDGGATERSSKVEQT
jgi:hypothetical protein